MSVVELHIAKPERKKLPSRRSSCQETEMVDEETKKKRKRKREGGIEMERVRECV